MHTSIVQVQLVNQPRPTLIYKTSNGKRDIQFKLTLFLYLNGASGRADKTMIGLIDFPNSASFHNNFSACKDVLGKVAIKEVNKVLDDCFEKEIEQKFLRNPNDYKTDFET